MRVYACHTALTRNGSGETGGAGPATQRPWPPSAPPHPPHIKTEGKGALWGTRELGDTRTCVFKGKSREGSIPETSSCCLEHTHTHTHARTHTGHTQIPTQMRNPRSQIYVCLRACVPVCMCMRASTQRDVMYIVGGARQRKKRGEEDVRSKSDSRTFTQRRARQKEAKRIHAQQTHSFHPPLQGTRTQSRPPHEHETTTRGSHSSRCGSSRADGASRWNASPPPHTHTSARRHGD